MLDAKQESDAAKIHTCNTIEEARTNRRGDRPERVPEQDVSILEHAINSIL